MIKWLLVLVVFVAGCGEQQQPEPVATAPPVKPAPKSKPAKTRQETYDEAVAARAAQIEKEDAELRAEQERVERLTKKAIDDDELKRQDEARAAFAAMSEYEKQVAVAIENKIKQHGVWRLDQDEVNFAGKQTKYFWPIIKPAITAAPSRDTTAGALIIELKITDLKSLLMVLGMSEEVRQHNLLLAAMIKNDELNDDDIDFIRAYKNFAPLYNYWLAHRR